MRDTVPELEIYLPLTLKKHEQGCEFVHAFS